jgi:hypothetical protein
VELTAQAMRVWGYNVLLTLGLALVLPAMASADGGKTIATAPVVAYGQQQFGNTATGQSLKGSCAIGGTVYRSYWASNVMAGDLLTINWEGVPGTHLKLVPVGTTDFNFAQTEPVFSQEVSNNGRNQAIYSAPWDGALPLYFEVCNSGSFQPPGPYNFTATDQHTVFTALAPRAAMRPTGTLIGTARLADGTPVPDGLAFTLTVRWGQHGAASFTATSSSGNLRFAVSIPKAAQQGMAEFEISRPADVSFLATKSAVDEVYVAQPPPKGKKPRRCRKDFKKRKVKGKVRCVKATKQAGKRRS